MVDTVEGFFGSSSGSAMAIHGQLLRRETVVLETYKKHQSFENIDAWVMGMRTQFVSSSREKLDETRRATPTRISQ
jgi:hypothetical protein